MLYVGYTSSDDNNDKLVYEIEYRKAGRSGWVLLKEDFLGVKLDWNTNTVEDGRYEVRVTASDRLNNTTATALTVSRISEQFVVDNSAPEIKSSDILIENDTVTVNRLIMGFTRFTHIVPPIRMNRAMMVVTPTLNSVDNE